MPTALVEYANPPGLPPAQGLYSYMGLIRQGTACHIAGHLAVGDDGEVVGAGNFAAQFAQVFRNLKRTLEAAGGSCRSIAKMTTFMTSADDIPEFMRLRAELFPTLFGDGVYPPNTLIIISRLVKPEFMLEVEAVAAL